MKKSDLKQIIKPIVEECVQESVRQLMLESGLLSSIISSTSECEASDTSEQIIIATKNIVNNIQI